jgi:type III secretion protein L
MRGGVRAAVTKIDRTSPWHDLPPAPTTSVMRPKDFEAWKNGFAFKEAAQARARMIEEAARDAHRAARERGYDEGYRAGLSEGQKAISEQIAKTSVEVSKYLNSIDGQIVGTVMAAVRSVLGGIPHSKQVIDAATDAMNGLRDTTSLRVRAHPDVAKEVDAALQTLAARSGSSVRVEADPGLPSRTSLVLETPFAVVNAGIEEQLAAIERAMRARPRGAPGQPVPHKPPEVLG